VVGVSDYTRKVLSRWIIDSKKLPEDYIFTRLKGDKRKPLTRDHYRELVKRWARIARADPRAFSTHSLRRTKAAYIYEQTRNIEVIRELLGQKSVSATSAYLNVGKKKALERSRGSLTFDRRCTRRRNQNCRRSCVPQHSQTVRLRQRRRFLVYATSLLAHRDPMVLPLGAGTS
jgi:hypothetical protein